MNAGVLGSFLIAGLPAHANIFNYLELGQISQPES